MLSSTNDSCLMLQTSCHQILLKMNNLDNKNFEVYFNCFNKQLILVFTMQKKDCGDLYQKDCKAIRTEEPNKKP